MGETLPLFRPSFNKALHAETAQSGGAPTRASPSSARPWSRPGSSPGWPSTWRIRAIRAAS